MLQERYCGALLGLAAGDAVGTTVEFKSPGSFAPVTDMVGGGPFDLRPGQWTDDTSMALCLAESLVATGSFDPTDQLERYLRWYRDGYLSSTGACFDIGNATAAALGRFARTREPFSGSTDPRSAGNGSIMRLAPVPLAYAANPREAIRLAGQSSRTTHGAATTIDGCRYLAALLIGAVDGVTKEELLSPRYSPVPGLWEELPLHSEDRRGGDGLVPRQGTARDPGRRVRGRLPGGGAVGLRPERLVRGRLPVGGQPRRRRRHDRRRLRPARRGVLRRAGYPGPLARALGVARHHRGLRRDARHACRANETLGDCEEEARCVIRATQLQ